MSLLSLPDELLNEILSYTPRFTLDDALLCKRTYPMVMEVLQSRVWISGVRSMHKYARLLHRSSAMASKVRYLSVDVRSEPDDYALTKLWGLLRPPLLPNCLGLSIGSDEVDESPGIPFEELFTWVANCPSLRRLVINNSYDGVSSFWGNDVGYEDPILTLEDVGIDIPKTLTQCVLNECNMVEAYSAQFWQLFGWVEHLTVEFRLTQRADLRLDGFELLRHNLRHLSLAGMAVDEEIFKMLTEHGEEFVHLEQLDCLMLDPVAYYFPFQTLRILSVRLSKWRRLDAADDEPAESRATQLNLRNICRGLKAGMFPVLKELKLKSYLSNFAELVCEEELDLQCAKLSVNLIYLLDLGDDSHYW